MNWRWNNTNNLTFFRIEHFLSQRICWNERGTNLHQGRVILVQFYMDEAQLNHFSTLLFSVSIFLSYFRARSCTCIQYKKHAAVRSDILLRLINIKWKWPISWSWNRNLRNWIQINNGGVHTNIFVVVSMLACFSQIHSLRYTSKCYWYS